MAKKSNKVRHGYAIVRIDDYFVGKENIGMADVTECVSVKAVLWDANEAQAEVDRLNKLNGHKGCYYQLQITRVQI